MKSQLPSRIRNIWLALIGGLLALGLGMVSLQIHRYTDLIDSAAEANREQGMVLSKGLQYAIDNVESVAKLMAGKVATDLLAGNASALQNSLELLVTSQPFIDAVKLTDSRGKRYLASTDTTSLQFSPESFSADALPKFAVSTLGSINAHQTSYVRAVQSISGQFIGTLELSLSPEAFVHLIDKLRIHQQQHVALVGPAGQWIYGQENNEVSTTPWLSKPEIDHLVMVGEQINKNWHIEELSDGPHSVEIFEIRIAVDGAQSAPAMYLIAANEMTPLLNTWRGENIQMAFLFLAISLLAIGITKGEARRQAERLKEKADAETLLVESAQRLKLATSSAGIGVWEYAFDTNMVKMNATMRQHYGLSADAKEMELQAWLNLIRLEDRAEFAQMFQHKGNASEAMSLRFQAKARNSATSKYMQVSARYYHGSEDRPARVVGVNSDITKQVVSEAALREAKSKFKITFESAAVGMMVFGLDDKIQSVNRACEDILGFNETLLNNMTVQALSHPQDVKYENQMKTALLEGKKANIQLEKRMIHKRGHVIWVHMAMSVVRDEQDKPMFFLCQVQDITKRKRSEAALIEREHFLRTLSECLPGLVSYWGRDFRCHFANRNYESWTGLKLEKLKGIHLRELHGDEVFSNDLPRLHAVLGGQSLQFERRLHKPDGTQADVLVHLIPDVIHGKVEGFFKLSTDISTLKKQQRELEQVNTELAVRTEQAEKANQTKSTFLANMSHEIRTPMNAIMGLLQLVNETRLDAKQKNYLNKIGSAAEVLLNVLNDVLDVSRIEANRLELNPARFGLDALLEKTVDLFSYSANEKGIGLSVVKAPNCPSSLVADRLRLAQILNNLLSNALKFTEKGNIKLGVRQIEGGKYLEFSVADSGMGMTQAQADSLFSPFSQLDNSSSRRFGGAGLGLSICKSLSELMGGFIGVTSVPGKGSTFTFRIVNEAPNYDEIDAILPGDDEPTQPVNRRARFAPSPSANQDLELLETTPEQPSSPLSGLHVLVVDDHKLNRMVAGEMIRNAGAKVSLAEDGRQAVDMVIKNTYDIVLMDLQMPEMDGFEATAAIKETLHENAPPIVAITASATEKDREAVLNAGMIEHLVKPFKKEDLIRIISEKGLGKNPLIKVSELPASTAT